MNTDKIRYHIDEVVHLIGDSDNLPEDVKYWVIQMLKSLIAGNQLTHDEVHDILMELSFELIE